MDTELQPGATAGNYQETLDNQSSAIKAAKKPPRKPRPSEIAAKKAKAAKSKKAKPAKKAVKKSGAKKKAKARKPKKTARSARKRVLKAAKAAGPYRCLRLDMRITRADKARVKAKAKALKRTITSIVLEAVAKIK